VRLSVVLALMCFCVAARAASTETGEQAYASSKSSVLPIYLNDSAGTPAAFGLLTSSRTLITNDHVIEAGDPLPSVGSEVKIMALDKSNDFAKLAITVKLISKQLPLSSKAVNPGEQIYTGSSEGLERSIRQGIVSGMRKREGRDLTTSPISHGSASNPVLNANGELSVVAGGMLQGWQNVNLMVPVDYVKPLMNRKPDALVAFSLQESLRAAAELAGATEKATYSDTPNSEYQVAVQKLHDTLKYLLRNTNNADALGEAACYGTLAFELSDAGIEAARNLVTIEPGAENQALLAYLLYDRAEDELVTAAIEKDGSDRQRLAKTAYDKFLSEAGEMALRTTRSARGNALILADYVLGNVKGEKGKYAEAIPLHIHVIDGEYSVCGEDIVKDAFQNLIHNSLQANRPVEAEKWFHAYSSKYQPTAWEWDQEGARRHAADDPASAAQAYENAAAAAAAYNYDYCYAAANRYLDRPQDGDAVLADGQACVDVSTKISDEDAARKVEAVLPNVYNYMATVLKDRGLYAAALQDAKKAIDRRPYYPFAYNTEAEIFSKLNQNAECIDAAQNAIRVSDGKYPFMDFTLGNCYFDTKDWAMAADSFRIAAVADKTDVSSAFNLALALKNQEREADAREWFHEALRRNPDSVLQARILKFLQ
jgi:tetratricopeptide (TPR) repeat protein